MTCPKHAVRADYPSICINTQLEHVRLDLSQLIISDTRRALVLYLRKS